MTPKRDSRGFRLRALFVGVLMSMPLFFAGGCDFAVNRAVSTYQITDVETGEPVAGAEVTAEGLILTPDFYDQTSIPYRLAPTDDAGMTYAPVQSTSPLETVQIDLLIEKDNISQRTTILNATGETATGGHFVVRVVENDGAAIPEHLRPTLEIVADTNPPVLQVDGYTHKLEVCSVDEMGQVWTISSAGWYLEQFTVGILPEHFGRGAVWPPFGDPIGDEIAPCGNDIPEDAPPGAFVAWVYSDAGTAGPLVFCLDREGAAIDCPSP